MAYPMTPPDPTAVVGRRILAFVLDFALVAIAFTVVAIPAFNSASLTAPADEVNCPNSGSTSFDAVEDPSLENPSVCLTIDDDEVRYIPEDEQGAFAALVWGTVLLTGAANNVLLQGLAGGSLGKLALGLRVIRHDGRRANVGWNLLRWAMFMVGTVICFLGWIVDLVMVLSTKGHRRLGDLAAGTLVVGKADEGTPPQIVGVTTQAMAPPGYPQPGPYPGQPAGYGTQPTWTAPPSSTLPGAPPVTPQPPPVEPPAPAADGPTWDEARDAYIQYDPEVAEWVQWDAQENRWRSIDQ